MGGSKEGYQMIGKEKSDIFFHADDDDEIFEILAGLDAEKRQELMLKIVEFSNKSKIEKED